MSKAFNAFAYLYVLGCKDGPHKIGYSYVPKARAKAMIREGREGVFVVGEWPVGARIAQTAERYSHWLLRGAHLGKEWFNVSREEAIAAVTKALEPDVLATLDPRNMIPPTATPDNKLRDGEYITTKFPAGTRARLREELGDHGHSDFIRDLIDRELKRRERTKPKQP